MSLKLLHSCAAASAAAEKAADAAEAAESGGSTAPELDEFGRDTGLMRRREADERAARRRLRTRQQAEQISQHSKVHRAVALTSLAGTTGVSDIRGYLLQC